MAMTVFEMVFGIVLIGAIAGMYKSKQQSKRYHSRSEEEISELDGRMDKLEDLEKRIQVLETIVTSKNYDLKDEIDRL